MNSGSLSRKRVPELLLRRIPKAELHIHVEGSLEAEPIFALVLPIRGRTYATR